MSKCEICVSQIVCKWWENGMGKNLYCTDEVVCPEYKDKSLIVEFLVKVGQLVYVPWIWEGQTGIATVTVEEIKLYDTNTSHYMFFIDMESDDESFNQMFGGWKIEQSIGKTVFTNKEDAERKLKEVGG